MKKWIGVLLILLALTAVIVWRRGGSRGTHVAPTPTSATTTSTAPTVFRAADGTDRKIPAWMLAAGAPPRRIAGRVTFRGQPVKNALVQLQSQLTVSDIAVPTEQHTDASGTFDFGMRPATGYDVTASSPDATAAIAHIELANPKLDPPPDRLELILGECSESVEGTVYDASNNPLPKVRVRRNGLVGGEADAKGHYKVCVPFGDAELHYSADGYGSVILTIEARGQMVRDVVLVPEATLNVRVVGAETMQPVEGALVTANPAAWAPDRPRPASGITDADGRVRIDALVPGRYRVFAIGDNAQTTAPSDALAEVGVATEVTLKLVATAKVTGHVTSANKPIAGVEVSAIRKAPIARSPAAYTQSDGSFVLDHVPVGDVGFIAFPYEVESPMSIQTTAGKTADVTITVHALGTIRGHVVRLGKPVPNVSICCVQNVAGLGPQAVSGPDGAYEYRGVPAGDYDLQAGTDEIGAFNMPFHVKLAAGEEKTADLDLDMAGAISGTVVDKSGAPVPGVYVRWTHQTTGDLGRGMTNAKGEYRCGAMTGGGSYRAAVFPSAELTGIPYPTATGAPYPSVDVADGKTVVENVTIAIDHATRSISGRVVDDTGGAVPDATVKALPVAGDEAPQFNNWLRLPTTSTDADGSFTLADLAPGHYALEAHGADGGEGVATGIEAGSKNVMVKVERAGSITGTLVGFTKPPVVYATPVGPFKLLSGIVEGPSFRIAGLRPGRYTVNAQTAIEGDVQRVDVKSGQATKVTLTSHGQGRLEANVIDFRSKKALGGATCRSVLQFDGEQAMTNWDLATAPKADANGHVVIDPAPAGSVSVICEPQGYKWSVAIADANLATGGQATLQLFAVELLQENPTSTGAELDWRVTPPRIAIVQPNTPAAAAGILPGDLVTAVDGVSVAGLCGAAVSQLIASTPTNSDVKLTLQRGAATKTVTVKALHMPGR